MIHFINSLRIHTCTSCILVVSLAYNGWAISPAYHILYFDDIHHLLLTFTPPRFTPASLAKLMSSFYNIHLLQGVLTGVGRPLDSFTIFLTQKLREIKDTQWSDSSYLYSGLRKGNSLTQITLFFSNEECTDF